MPTNTPFALPRPKNLSWLSWPIKAIEKITGLSKLSKMHSQYDASSQADKENIELFLDHALHSLNIKYEVIAGDTASIPSTGSTLIVANHPLGGAEGLLLARTLLSIRKDIKVLTNELLKRIPEFADVFIGVDVFAQGKVRKQNLEGIKAAKQYLQNGGALLLFPAGEVSSFDLKQRTITDIQWNRLVGYFCKQSKCAVVPIFIEAYNSPLFYLAGLIHPLLRTIMLPREMLRKKKDKIKLSIGEKILHDEYAHLDKAAITQYLRDATYALKNPA